MRLSPEHRERLVFAAVGLVEGLAWWWAGEGAAAGLRAPAAALAAFALAGGTAKQFAWTGASLGRLAALASAVGLVLAAPALWVWGQLEPAATFGGDGDGFRTLTYAVAFPVVLYVALPFAQIYQETGRPRFAYADLFRHAWTNVFVLAVAGGVLGIGWGLLGLWAGLFKVLDVDAFYDLFFDRPFADLFTFAALGFGVALGLQSERVVAALRTLTLTVFRALLPLLAAIALLFLAALPFTGLAPLWATRSASPALLWVVILAVLFLNAVVQDAGGPPPYPTWLRRGVEAMVAVLPAFAGLALYAIGLRIAQHGLMPERVYVVVFAVVGGLFGAGYAAAVLRQPSPWMAWLRPVNVTLAVAVAALALLLHTPLLDPLAMSARDQYARLAGGRAGAASFDYGSLHFKLGRPGREALDALAALEDHPEREAVRANVAAVRRATSYWDWRRQEPGLSPERTRILTPDGTLPEGLSDLIGAAGIGGTAGCGPLVTCLVFPVNADRDGDAEYALVAHNLLYLFDRDASGSWVQVGELRAAGALDVERLAAAVERGDAAAAEPLYRDIRVGSHLFRFGTR